MRKSRAFLLHLGASAAVAAAALLVFVRLWYPLPYFVADGGWQGLRLVALVDVVLGPLLTLVIYKQTKSRRALVFDYVCIGLVQVAALSLGLGTVYGQRTEIVAFADGRFYTVDAKTVGALGPQAQALLGETRARPAYAVVRMPDGEEERQDLRRETLRSGMALHLRADLFHRLDREALAALEADDPWHPSAEEQPALRPLERLQGADGSKPVLLPVTCRYRDVVLAFDRGSAALLDWVLLPEAARTREVRVKAGSP
jgi:hypothetical protein